MTNRQKIELRLSQVRARLNTISGLEGEAFTDEIRAEGETLQVEYHGLEARYQDAIIAEPGPEMVVLDSEQRERARLVERASMSNFMLAAMEHRALDGPEKELVSLERRGAWAGGIVVPWAVLVAKGRGAGRQAVEVRAADANTALPVGGEVAEQDYVGRVFAGSVSEFLAARILEADGAATVPIVAGRRRGGPIRTRPRTFRQRRPRWSSKLQARRGFLQSYSIRVEDIRRSPGLADALRVDLMAALVAAMDKKLVDTLLGGITAAVDATALGTFTTILTSVAGGVDGIHAGNLMQVRALLGVDSYALAASVQAANGESSVADYLGRNAGGIQASAHLPATANKKQVGILARIGAPGNTAQVLHGSPEMIVDPYSGAGAGIRKLTLLAFHEALILRPGGFKLFSTQTKA